MTSSFKSERGSELLEFAFASSLLFSLVFAILLGGLTIYQYNMLAEFAQDGVRYASVRGKQSQGTFFSGGTVSGVRSYIQSRDPGVTVVLAPNSDPNTLAVGTTLTVSVSRPMPGWVGFGVWSSTNTMTASSSMQMAR